jgi:uncharacterized membrane protein YfcA
MDMQLVFLICFIGGLLQGATSFGFAIFLMSLLPFVIPFKTASILVSFLNFIIGSQMFFLLRKNLNLKIFLAPVLSSIVSGMVGVHLLMLCREDLAKRILGAVLVLLAIYFVYFSNKNLRLVPNLKFGVIIGVISGLLCGMFNIGGPPLVIYYLYTTASNLEFKANIEFHFAIMALGTTMAHLAYGNVNPELIKLGVIGVISVVTAGFIGLKIFKRLNRNLLCKCIYILMFIMGALLVIKGH